MLNDRKRKARINHNDYDLRIEIDYKICAVVWSIWTSTCLHINKMEARSLVFNRVSKELVGIALIAMFLFYYFCRFYKSSKFAQKYATGMVECEYSIFKYHF